MVWYAFFHDVLQEEEKQEKKVVSKYAVKPPKDLKSKYEAKVAAKEREEEERKEQKLRDEEAKKIAVSKIVL